MEESWSLVKADHNKSDWLIATQDKIIEGEASRNKEPRMLKDGSHECLNMCHDLYECLNVWYDYSTMKKTNIHKDKSLFENWCPVHHRSIGKCNTEGQRVLVYTHCVQGMAYHKRMDVAKRREDTYLSCRARALKRMEERTTIISGPSIGAEE